MQVSIPPGAKQQLPHLVQGDAPNQIATVQKPILPTFSNKPAG